MWKLDVRALQLSMRRTWEIRLRTYHRTWRVTRPEEQKEPASGWSARKAQRVRQNQTHSATSCRGVHHLLECSFLRQTPKTLRTPQTTPEHQIGPPANHRQSHAHRG